MDIVDIYVITFILSKYFGPYGNKEGETAYICVIFSNIFCSYYSRLLFIREEKKADIICQLILYFHIISNHWHNLVVIGSNSKHSVLRFY